MSPGDVSFIPGPSHREAANTSAAITTAAVFLSNGDDERVGAAPGRPLRSPAGSGCHSPTNHFHRVHAGGAGAIFIVWSAFLPSLQMKTDV